MEITEIEKEKWNEKATKFSAENQNWSFSGSYDNSFPSVQLIESSFIGYRFPRMIMLDTFLKKFPFLKRFVAYITILLEKSEKE